MNDAPGHPQQSSEGKQPVVPVDLQSTIPQLSK